MFCWLEPVSKGWRRKSVANRVWTAQAWADRKVETVCHPSSFWRVLDCTIVMFCYISRKHAHTHATTVFLITFLFCRLHSEASSRHFFIKLWAWTRFCWLLTQWQKHEAVHNLSSRDLNIVSYGDMNPNICCFHHFPTDQPKCQSSKEYACNTKLQPTLSTSCGLPTMVLAIPHTHAWFHMHLCGKG